MRTLRDIRPGQTIGRYEFLVPIAEGGMAAVWASRLKGSRGFQKILAIKTILATLSDNEQFEEMFLGEAQIAARIRHPNVAEIFDLGEEDDVLFLVMEWVDGEPLSTIFRTAQKKSGVPLGIAVRVVADACAGLHAAHELRDDEGAFVNLVHRDVSPQNILVTYDGNVKIVDFGVAKATGLESSKTSAGTIKGKAPYMSPEQALGQEIDRRTDIFALGIILYHLTTGKHPFRADNDMVTLTNIIERPCPPPTSFQPGFPRPLEAAILKALEKDPAKRFQTAAEFEAALDRVMPPTAPRIRATDVGRFVRDTVGDRGEKRRDAIRQAVRLADERLQNEIETARLASKPVAEIGLTGTLGTGATSVSTAQIPASMRGSLPSLAPNSAPPTARNPDATDINPLSSSSSSITSLSSPGVASTTPPGSRMAEAPKSKGRMIAVVGGVLAVAAVAAGAVAMSKSGSSRATASDSPASQNTAAVTATATTTASATATPTTTAPAVASGAASAETGVDLSSLPTADTATPTAKSPPAGGAAPHSAPEKPTPPSKGTTAGKTKPGGGGGYVPPPVNDPGF